MNLELYRVAIAVGLTSIAAWQDNKTSYVSDWVLFSMIGAGILFDILSFDVNFFLSILPITALIAIGGYFLWKRGSFGQGDVWLFLGLQLLLPEYPSFTQFKLPHFPFVGSVFLAASVFSVIGSSAFYAFKLSGKKLLNGIKLDFFLAAGAVFVIALFFLPFSPAAKLLLGLFALSSVFLALFYKTIKEKVLVQFVPLHEVEDEDVIALEHFPAKLVSKYSLGPVATKKEVAKLRKMQDSGELKKFPVYKDLIRFNPYVLAGLVACLYAGDLLVWALLR